MRDYQHHCRMPFRAVLSWDTMVALPSCDPCNSQIQTSLVKVGAAQPWGALRAILLRVSGLVTVPGMRQEAAALATKVAGAAVPLLKPGGDACLRGCTSCVNTLWLKADGQCVCMAGMQGILTARQGDDVMIPCVLLRAGTEEAWGGPGMAVECLVAAVSASPAVSRAHLKPLEDYAMSALMGQGSSSSARQSASHLLSLLPSVTGRRKPSLTHWASEAAQIEICAANCAGSALLSLSRQGQLIGFDKTEGLHEEIQGALAKCCLRWWHASLYNPGILYLVLCCCLTIQERILDWPHAGKPEQWTTLFQVLTGTAHAQLDALYSGLQSTQEANTLQVNLWHKQCITPAGMSRVCQTTTLAL